MHVPKHINVVAILCFAPLSTQSQRTTHPEFLQFTIYYTHYIPILMEGLAHYVFAQFQ